MRVPTRRNEILHAKPADMGPYYITQSGLDRLKKQLVQLEKIDIPKAIEDVKRTGEFGDFSENFEYQEAKYHLRRLHSRVLTTKDRLKRARIIEKQPDQLGRTQVGSTVIVEVQEQRKTYQIVGQHETDPFRGRISHSSPLGVVLLHHVVGDEVSVQAGEKELIYRILEIQ